MALPPKNSLVCPPPLPLENYLIFFMFSHLDSRIITDVNLEMIPGVQTKNGIPPDKYDIPIAHALTNRKDDIFMQGRLYIDKAHTALDIFRFAVFFICTQLS